MRRVETWHAELFLFEEDDTTRANVVLRTAAGREVRASGTARRNPRDTAVPEIGDELAVARALSALGHELLDLTVQDIEAITHRPVTHLSA